MSEAERQRLHDEWLYPGTLAYTQRMLDCRLTDAMMAVWRATETMPRRSRIVVRHILRYPRLVRFLWWAR